MKKSLSLIPLALSAMVLGACGHSSPASPATVTMTVSDPTDSTLYGLSCDGTNDTLLVYIRLPYTGTDPDTLQLFDATRRGQVFGEPRIGDQLAIIRSAADSTVVERVVVMEDLHGRWCYKVRPVLRAQADGRQMQAELLPDSLRQLLETEVEYGYDIKDENVVRTVGGPRHSTTSDDDSPVQLPALRRYREWHIHNGRLVLSSSTTDTLGVTTIQLSDTADILLLTSDSLVLSFATGQQQFYRTK